MMQADEGAPAETTIEFYSFDCDDIMDENDDEEAPPQNGTIVETVNELEELSMEVQNTFSSSSPSATEARHRQQRPQASSRQSPSLATSYDPYGPREGGRIRVVGPAQQHPLSPPATTNSAVVQQQSLLDDDDLESVNSSSSVAAAEATGLEKFLEMEEENDHLLPPSRVSRTPGEPITTSSGLMLTHRKTPLVTSTQNPVNRLFPHHYDVPEEEYKKDSASFQSPPGGVQRRAALHHRERLEMEWHRPNSNFGFGGHAPPPFLKQAQRVLSYVRVWVLVSAFVLLAGTVVVIHHHIKSSSSEFATTAAAKNEHVHDSSMPADAAHLVPLPDAYDLAQITPQDRVVLMPLYPTNNYQYSQQQQQQQQRPHPYGQTHAHVNLPGRRLMREFHELRGEFEQWVQHHGKTYHSQEEKERRFQVWTDNHHRTLAKNERHGPCKLTKQPVFGSNHFKDLTRDEFSATYLNSRRPPAEQQIRHNNKARASRVMNPKDPVQHHPYVHRRMKQQAAQNNARPQVQASYQCKWYDISCNLRYIFTTYFYGFYGIGTTLEPAYDSDSYPSYLDWREMGAVTGVRTQGGCGACWAITAVETVESAVFLGTGTLYDLSETEVIVCAEECQMCNGGWPEEAFDWIIEHDGVALKSDIGYDANWLLTLSQVKAGESDELDESTVSQYASQTCPADGSNDSHDSQDYQNYESNSYAHYGRIKGYGYATDRCVCYTDGTGCDCDSQNEGLAVGNVATYGPSVVCIDASEWQDYDGGIITSSSGCSSAFLDVNHCAQVVGYAFLANSDDSEGGGSQDNSHDNSGSGDSRDGGGSRDGYWIVKNSWSIYWGMNGYAYVAMGDNTCGILNDMIQAEYN